MSSEAVSELFYLVACERKRTKNKNKNKNTPEVIALQHTRAVDVFLHSSTLVDDKIEAVILDCETIYNNVYSVPNLCMDFVVVCF